MLEYLAYDWLEKNDPWIHTGMICASMAGGSPLEYMLNKSHRAVETKDIVEGFRSVFVGPKRKPQTTFGVMAGGIADVYQSKA